jgi:signal transduction histidine kinase
MRTLGAKIALIFIGSMFAVVLLATTVTAIVLNRGDVDRAVVPMARHISMTSEVLGEGGFPRRRPPLRRIPQGEIVENLPAGERLVTLSLALQEALAAEGETRHAEVIDAGDREPVAGLQLEDGRWMLFSFPKPFDLPPEVLFALGAWLALMVTGIVTVALVMAQRVTRPFAILDNAVRSVGPDGVLPHTPEIGSGEARQTAMALNALSDRLRGAMESRMRLVAAAGHDLRTPMTRMRLRAEFLPEEDRVAWLADLDELDAIADSAIKLVKEEGAGEDREPVPLDVLVRETVIELSVAKLPVELTAAEPTSVAAGPLALRRALRNLITNAATHGGGARVRLEADENTARILIEDDGPGIPSEMLSQVFEPFFRASPARTQTTKGAGLGLAIAREIIERFGGSIEISNRPEGGLLQVVRLRALAAAG